MTWLQSIRGRFQLWLAFLLIILLTAFGITGHHLYKSRLLDRTDEELNRRLAALSADVHSPQRLAGEPGSGPPSDRKRGRFWEAPPGFSGSEMPGTPLRSPEGPGSRRPLRLSATTQQWFGSQESDDFYFVIWQRNGETLARSTNAPLSLAAPSRQRGDTTPVFRTRDRSREVVRFTELGDSVLVGRSMTRDLEDLTRFGWWMALGGATVLVIALGGGWWLVSQAMRPVEVIGHTANRISRGNLSERISVPNAESELGQLSAVLNSTFARLEEAFSQQRRFTADAAHELRTPLAVWITEAQATLSRERTREEYRQALDECLSVAQHMRQLTESLLQLARLDARQELLERTPQDLAMLAHSVLDLLTPLAEARSIQWSKNLEPASFLGDPGRIQQVIANLVSNAVRFSPEGGVVTLSSSVEGDRAVLSVQDEGPGIPESDLPRVFERFYRVDVARSSEGGHSGLGLAISQAIVEAHGGNIRVTRRPSGGCCFTVTLVSAASAGVPPA